MLPSESFLNDEDNGDYVAARAKTIVNKCSHTVYVGGQARAGTCILSYCYVLVRST